MAIRGISETQLCSLDEAVQESAIDHLLDALESAPGHWEAVDLSDSEVQTLLAGVQDLYDEYLAKPVVRRQTDLAARHNAFVSCRNVARDILVRVRNRDAIAFVMQNVFTLQPDSMAISLDNFVAKHLGPQAFFASVRGFPVGFNHLIAALVCSEAVTPELVLDLIATGDVQLQGHGGMYTRDHHVSVIAFIVEEKLKARHDSATAIRALPVVKDQPGTRDAEHVREIAALLADPALGLIADTRPGIGEVESSKPQ